MKNNEVRSAAAQPARDLNVDFLRGAFILMIALDHLGWMVKRAVSPVRVNFPFPTWTHIGWTSAAEFFVFFSGYVIGLVYIRTLRNKGFPLLTARAWHRAWQLYCFNVITWVIAAAAVSLLFQTNTQMLYATQFDRAYRIDGFEALTRFALLQGGPAFFDILQLYMIFLIVTPILLYLAQKKVFVLLIFSAALWAASQLFPEITLHRSGSRWGFNPLSWQLMFCLGIIAARIDLFALLRKIPRPARLVATGIPIAVVVGLKAAEALGWSGFLEASHAVWLGKQNLGLLRVAHFALSLVFLFSLLPPSGAIGNWWIGQVVIRVGQFSLETFCFSTIVCYVLASLVIVTLGTSTWAMVPIGFAAIALILAFAAFVEWLKKEPWR
jgi:hypothetical protein